MKHISIPRSEWLHIIIQKLFKETNFMLMKSKLIELIKLIAKHSEKE